MRHSIDLRRGDVPGFGDDFTRRKWEAECVQALAVQIVDFAIAPRRGIRVRGRLLRAGDEVRREDFDDQDAFNRHVRDGDILVATNGPEAA